MSTKKIGLVQAAGVAAYCSFIGLILGQGGKIFPKFNPYFGPVVMLLIFSTSALICGLIVFYKPYKLFSEGKKKEAIDAVVSTALCLFVFVLIFFLLMIAFK